VYILYIFKLMIVFNEFDFHIMKLLSCIFIIIMIIQL